jgi:hypothetical protein
VAPHLSKHRKEAVLSDALKSGLIMIILLGVPVLLAVPIVTYFTSEFVNVQQFTIHAVRNLAMPAIAVFALAILGGIVSMIRR